MDAETMLAYCFAKPGAWADNPGDHEYPVVKVGDAGMLFDFLGSSGVGVKCGSTARRPTSGCSATRTRPR
ncbi:MAG TPA: hypothetical protein PKM36_01995 [Propionibacteriaceae bacterium]|nr:hypothetical protein [Propionibacteriaceae bacterium]